jgi:hypothetical protein
MTLQSSGLISLGDVRTELAASGTIGLGDSNVRTLAGVASGAIGLSNLYGKTRVVPVGGMIRFQLYSNNNLCGAHISIGANGALSATTNYWGYNSGGTKSNPTVTFVRYTNFTSPSWSYYTGWVAGTNIGAGTYTIRAYNTANGSGGGNSRTLTSSGTGTTAFTTSGRSMPNGSAWATNVAGYNDNEQCVAWSRGSSSLEVKFFGAKREGADWHYVDITRTA